MRRGLLAGFCFAAGDDDAGAGEDKALGECEPDATGAARHDDGAVGHVEQGDQMLCGPRGSVKQIAMLGHVLRDGLRRSTEDASTSSVESVVAVLAMQSRHRRDVLRNMLGQPDGLQQATPVIERQILGGISVARVRR